MAIVQAVVNPSIEALTGHIGARVSGVDPRQLRAGDIECIRDALHQHLAVFIPSQPLSAEQLVEFAEQLGVIEPPHGGLQAHSSNPKVMITERRQGGGTRNDTWHSDVSFDETPPSVSILQALEVPDAGGDTMFASQYAAYEGLVEPMRALVDGLEAFHDGLPGFTRQLDGVEGGAERVRRLRSENRTAVHPVVRVHPVTGRRALYVNRLFTQRIVGLSEIEGRGLLDMLCEHSEQPSFQVRWRWQAGDIAVWDNRCVIHYAANDVGDATRVMQRITLTGERPVG